MRKTRFVLCCLALAVILAGATVQAGEIKDLSSEYEKVCVDGYKFYSHKTDKAAPLLSVPAGKDDEDGFCGKRLQAYRFQKCLDLVSFFANTGERGKAAQAMTGCKSFPGAPKKHPLYELFKEEK